MSAVVTMRRDNLPDLLEAVRAARDLVASNREQMRAASALLADRQKALGEALALDGLIMLGDWVLVRRTECSKEQLEQAAAQCGGST